MEIKSTEIKIMPIGEIKPTPNNRNKHPQEQIDRLAEIIKYQGFRDALIVSNQSGFLVSGNGRLEAAKLAGLTHVPVSFQDFDSPEQEYAAAISLNSISLWAELDLAGINADMPDLGPDFDINLLGIKDFTIDPSEIEMPDIGDGKDSMIIQRTFTLSTEQSDIVSEALKKAEEQEDCSDEINQNGPGNALAAMASAYVRR